MAAEGIYKYIRGRNMIIPRGGLDFYEASRVIYERNALAIDS